METLKPGSVVRTSYDVHVGEPYGTLPEGTEGVVTDDGDAGNARYQVRFEDRWYFYMYADELEVVA